MFHSVVAAALEGSAAGPPEVRFNLLAEVEAEAAIPVTLVISIFKFDHMEWAIEKATELESPRSPPSSRDALTNISRRQR